MLFAVAVVGWLAAAVRADITGSTPPTGACICVDGNSVNVRDGPCGNVISQTGLGLCYKYRGTKSLCTLNGVAYEYFNLDFNPTGPGGWIAGNFLNHGADSQCTACPNIVTRAEWGGRPPRSVSNINHPILRYFVHHTASSACTTQAACAMAVREIQNYHMDTNGWDDIGYSFLVGEDGNVFEGRGWDHVGAHTANYNAVSVGVGVIGTYSNRNPNEAALLATQHLISCGILSGKLSASYLVHGGRDGSCSDSPGDALYATVQTWPRYGGTLAGGC